MRHEKEPPITVIHSRNGQNGLAILSMEQVANIRSSFSVGICFTVQLEPKGPESRLVVVLDNLLTNSLKDLAQQEGWSYEKLLFDVGIHAIGRYLDEAGKPPFTPSIVNAAQIPGTRAAQVYFEPPPKEPSDGIIFGYIGSKVYWGWRFGLAAVGFSEADARRLGVPVREFERVALAGEGKYWRRANDGTRTFSATPRLLEELPAGVLPGLERPSLTHIADRLTAPRYEASQRQFVKALAFMHGEQPDMPNAVKEAVAAVESLSLKISGLGSGTLGDCIKELKRQGRLSPPLGKVLEGLWGYSSEEPGVRHGKIAVPSVPAAEAYFAVNLAASAILYLLDLDAT